MKGYLSLFKMRLIAGMQYRAAAWAGVATQFFFGFMHLMVLFAFYQSAPDKRPMSYGELAAYVWMTQAFLALIMLWYQDSELFSMITSGNVAYELCRPFSLYPFWFAKLLATRLMNAAMRCLPILTITFFLPAPYRMTLPPSPAHLLLFLIALAFSLLIAVAVSMLIFILTFVTMSPIGSRLIVGVAADFLSGAYLPIPFMPQWMQRLLDYFPFRYTLDFPFRLYSGSIPLTDAATGIGVQMMWIIGLIVFGQFAMASVLRRTVIQGG